MTSPEPGTVRQEVSAVGGFAYGVIGADIHVFGDGAPVYLLFEHRALPRPDGTWLRAQPSRMLDARAELVDFTGRDAELAELHAWRDADPPQLAARWLHGEGGQGKTRLAEQLAHDAARVGWKVVDVVHGTDTHPPAGGSQDLRLNEKTVGVLVLVDYADRWPLSDLSWLINNSLLSQSERKKVRVLLIGRSVSSWRALRAKLDRLRTGFDLSDQFLSPLPDDDQVRDLMYTTARGCFVRQYPEVTESSAIAPPQPLGAADFGLTLAIHMAALVAVDAAARGRTPPTDMVGLSAYLLDREYENWRQLYENADRGLDYRTSDADMARTVFTAILTGSTARSIAERIIARLIPQVNTDNALADHAVCYPPADSTMALEPMIPDRLAEDFLALLVPGHPVTGFPADTWATGAPDTLLTATDTADYAPRALTFLASATDRWPHLGANVLYPLLSSHPAIALDGGSAALTAIATIGGHEDDISPQLLTVLETIGPLLPASSHADLDVGILSVVERLTERYLTDTTDPARRAALHSNLGTRRRHAGEWNGALTAQAEAARLYRQLVDNDARHRENLGILLNNLANSLADQGRWREALAQAREAVTIHRAALGQGQCDRGSLALSLAGLGRRLIGANRLDEAATVIEEAVRIHRELAKADPGRYGYELAIALTNLAEPLRDHGREDEAIAAAEEAVEWARRLARSDPAQYLGFLAASLNNLSRAHAGQRHSERAVAAQAEAVDAFRRLVRANPRAHRQNLLLALKNLSTMLVGLDRGREAVVLGEEAVMLARQLAEGCSMLGQRHLAGCLEALGDILSRLGRADQALGAYREAADTHLKAEHVIHSAGPEHARLNYRLAALYREAGDRENEAAMLVNFCGGTPDGGPQRPDVVDAARRAVTLYRELGDRAWEAATLLQLSRLLTEPRCQDEAITACQRAAAIYHEDGDQVLEYEALINLSGVLLRAERYDDTVTASQSAIAIYRTLGAAPGAVEQRGQPLFNLGSALLATGRTAEAIPALEQAASVYQRNNKGQYEDSGNPAYEGDSHFLLGRAYFDVGRSADAVRAYQRAAELFELGGKHREHRKSLLAASEILVELGQHANAVVVSKRALAASQRAGDRLHEAWALAHLGAALLESGRLHDGVEHSPSAALIYDETAEVHARDGIGGMC